MPLIRPYHDPMHPKYLQCVVNTSGKRQSGEECCGELHLSVSWTGTMVRGGLCLKGKRVLSILTLVKSLPPNKPTIPLTIFEIWECFVNWQSTSTRHAGPAACVLREPCETGVEMALGEATLWCVLDTQGLKQQASLTMPCIITQCPTFLGWLVF